ncbi:MAG: ABC transporter permease [Dongiaceae bacterium]
MRYLSLLAAPALFVLGLILWSRGFAGPAWPPEVIKPWAYLLPQIVLAWIAKAYGFKRDSRNLIAAVDFMLAFSLAYELLRLLNDGVAAGAANPGFWLCLTGVTIAAWQAMASVGRLGDKNRAFVMFVPAIFGIGLIYAWQVIVTGFGVPQILLPAPSQIGHQIVGQTPMLWLDFQQTFLKSVIAGFLIGCGLGFAVAVATDRIPFLQRGLLPLGNLASAVPIVGIAPIMVMWFGFGWESKAAVIVVMTFFPMLINTIAGLAASDHMQRDLMRSYGAGYWQTFFQLRLPAALPFIFNALKINSTLALIGAIVAEMFGSPISGMGFRISTEVYKMNVDIVWATIAVAALAGSLFYGLLALLERGLTFWHPSYRARTQNR